MSKKDKRIDLYLQQSVDERYINTPEEAELVTKFYTLYDLAKSQHDKLYECNPDNLQKWRKAYEGRLGALKQDGSESERKGRQLRKIIYELVESKIDNSIPMPKISPRYKSDIPVVGITEEYLKFEANRILTKYINDKSERSTYVDGTSWYKIWWDSLDRTAERSGDVKIDVRTVDQIIPQPGIQDYKQLEYIFEIEDMSLTKIYDLYGRLLTPISMATNVIKVVTCYYLNSNRIVGKFMFSPDTMQVICNEEDWQIRKLRKCTSCGNIVPIQEECPFCGGKKFKFENAEEEILEEDLMEIYNPYEVGETDDESLKDQYKARVFLTAGTKVPFYKVRQLPFVPRPAVSSMYSMYGKSEADLSLEQQDVSNKLLTKATDKTMKSGAVVTKPEKMKISDKDDTFKTFGVRTAEEAAMVQVKQIIADTSQDMLLANMLYDNAKSASGITDSFQGKKDTTATSGKAKQYSALQSAGRIESLRVMKAAAFSGVYELILKYLLAFSDEKRKFVKVLPEGEQVEETWSKYMFLAKDKYGVPYYRDDFHFDCDSASSLSQNRTQMWQETQDKFVQGAFGVPNDTRTLKLFWNVMDSLQYPLARYALAGIKYNEQHLPSDIEQAIMQNPEIMQMIMQMIGGQQDGRGGARSNSGPAGNGNTHAANVNKTNAKNKAENDAANQAFSAQEVKL